jgi:putative transcriptional regulator
MLHPSLKGKFLIAMPELCDPNFAEGVVLICEHNDKGAFGLLINRKSKIQAKSKFEGIFNCPDHEWIAQQAFYIGGPVQSNYVLILYRSGNFMTKDLIVDDVALASSMTDFSSIPISKDTFVKGKENLRLYLGCSSWEVNQLESEIEMGTWKVLPSKTDMIFNEHPSRVWKQSLARLGGKYSILAQMPDSKDVIQN